MNYEWIGSAKEMISKSISGNSSIVIRMVDDDIQKSKAESKIEDKVNNDFENKQTDMVRLKTSDGVCLKKIKTK